MKRGISPLIGVVLLIVFVIAIITLIINFTKESIERGFEKSEKIFEGFSSCEEAKFFVERAECGSINNQNERRRNTDLLYIDIKNEKNINFRDAFVVKFLLEEEGSEISSTLDDTRLNAYEVKPVGIYRPFIQGDFGKNYKQVDTIEIIPRVKAGDEFVFCENQKEKIEVENC